MQLCPPFDGWHLDENGTIHTASGYRCTPLQIESALWLMQFSDVHGPRLMFADTAPGATRPVYELADLVHEDSARLIRIAKKRVCQVCRVAD